jgi:hypothetical protein
MPRIPLSPTLGDWINLVDQVAADAIVEQPPLDEFHAKLRRSLEEVQSLLVERDSYEARKQEASRKIQALLDQGRRQATLLRVTLREHYGPRSEKLAAFGIQPFRGRKPKRRNPKSPKEPSK